MDNKTFGNFQVEDFVTDESFLNYFFNSNEKDVLFWEKWIDENPRKSYMIDEAIEILHSMSFTLDKDSFSREYRKIETGINKKSPFTVKRILNWNDLSSQGSKIRRRSTYLLAGLLIIFCAAFFYNIRSGNEKIAVDQTVSSNNNNLVLTLSDSTVVTLYPHSSLQYPETFGGKNRDVFLKGEANFHVTRNAHFPFKVHTKDIITTVLGTIFNIKKSGDSAIVVEVIRGKVKVNAAADLGLSVLLYKNESAVYIKNGGHLYKNQKEPLSQSLSFRKNNFDEIAAKVKNVYGITLMNKSKKKNFLFTGEFKNSSAKEIVENICLIENLSFEISRDTITIK